MKRAVILKHMMVKGLATPPPEYLGALMAAWSEEERRKFDGEAQSHYARQVQQLRDGGLWETMARSEQDFMVAGPTEVSPQALIDTMWLAESAACLLWALGYVSELPPYDQPANPELTNKLPLDSVKGLVEKANLRPKDDVKKQRELAELWHWRARTRQLQEAGGMPKLLDGGVTIEKVIRMSANKAAEEGVVPEPIGDDFPAFNKPYRELTSDEFSIATSIAMERHRAFNWLCGYAPGNRWADTPTDT